MTPESFPPSVPYENQEIFSKRQTEIIQALQAHEGDGRESLKFQVSLKEMLDLQFLRAIADLQVPYEVFFFEQDGGGIISTSINDIAGHAIPGDASVHERHIQGAVSLHTHLGQEFYDICPSIGDIEILGMERIYAGSHGKPMIFNSQGILIFGFDPEYKKKETEEKEFGKYSWKLKNECLFKWEDLQNDIRFRDKTIDEAIQELLAFMIEKGIVKAHKTWDEVTEQDMALIFGEDGNIEKAKIDK